MNMIKSIEEYIIESSKIIEDTTKLSNKIHDSIHVILDCLNRGNKVVFFGNGGSAADAQHIAAEMIGRFKLERDSYPAIALTTDSSILTSLSNDYSFDIVFSRQCESLVNDGDIVIGISTSGESTNVKKGLKVAKEKGAIIIGLLGKNGGSISQFTDISIIIKSDSTPRIQEGHRVVYHIICDQVEKELEKGN